MGACRVSHTQHMHAKYAGHDAPDHTRHMLMHMKCTPAMPSTAKQLKQYGFAIEALPPTHAC